MKPWGVAVCLLLWVGTGWAADNGSSEPVRLEEIVVTATRGEQTVTQSPAMVSVVRKEQIENRGVKAMDQVVNDIPGIFNRRGKGLLDTQAAITLRGIPDQKRTLILLDGIVLNDPRVGTVNFGGLAPEDIERVEVVRGPFSSLYGGNAMGGVVQFLTKWPDKREVTLKSGYGTAWSRGEAQNDLWRSYVSYGDRLDDQWRMFLSFGYERTNGYSNDYNLTSTKPPASLSGWSRTTNNKGATQYLIGDRGDNAWSDYHGTAKLRYDFSEDSRLLAQFLRNTYDYATDNPHSYLRNGSGDPAYASTGVKEASYLSGYGHRAQNIYQLTWERKLGSVESKLSLGVNDQSDAWYVTVSTTGNATRMGGPGTKAETPSQGYNADLQVRMPIFERHRLTAGGAVKYETAATREYNMTNWRYQGSDAQITYESKGNGRTLALFFQGEIHLLDNLILYLGGREDWWETFDGYANSQGSAGYPKYYASRSDAAFSPKGSLVYRPWSQAALRLSGGSAFRAPTIYELYRSYQSGQNTYQANPNLSPEKALSWETGVEQHLWSGAVLKATYFENYLQDFIYQSTVGTNTFQNANAGRAIGKGIEFEMTQRLEKWLRIFASYTYTDTRITENAANPGSIDKQAPQVPRQVFNTGGEASMGKFSLALTGRYVGQRFSNDDNSDTANSGYGSRESYVTIDSKLSCRILSWATLSLSLDNLLDRTYYDYYRAPGRSWFLELTLKM